MRIKTLTYNVHKFFNTFRTEYFIDHFRELLLNLDVDIVFLQEFREKHPKKLSKVFDKDPLEHFADELWDYNIYGKNAVYPSGSHGNAILSKFPFNSWQNFDISNHKLERRGLLLGEVSANENNKLVLACTHLDLTAPGRLRQEMKIKSLLSERVNSHSPFLMGGDFNDWKGVTIKNLQSQGFLSQPRLPTFPSYSPFLCLDHFIFKNLHLDKFEVLRGHHWRKLSDHLPLLAEFYWES